MAALLCAMGGIMALYYLWPPGSALLSSYGAWQAAGGVVRVGLVAGFAGGVLGELSVVYFRDGGRWNARHVEDMAFRFVLFVVGGMVVSIFYIYQARWFGDGLTWRVVVPKVLVDQFVFSVFWSTTFYSIAFHWQAVRYSGRRLWADLTPDFIFDRMLPILITNWMFWIRGVTLVYCMPLPLQMPLNIFATAIWGVLLAALSRHDPSASKMDRPMPGPAGNLTRSYGGACCV